MEVLLVVRPKVLARALRVWCMESQGVESLVAHVWQNSSRSDHRVNDLVRLTDLLTSVDGVARKDGLALRMGIYATKDATCCSG